jgi:hypothetical protein
MIDAMKPLESPISAPRPGDGPARAASGVRLRTVALPVEHGGWGFVAEPIVLGLVVAPSIAGALFAVAMMAGFLLRHPLKIYVGDRRHGRSYPRTEAALRFASLYGAAALVAFAASLYAGPLALLWPLLLASPFALAQAYFDFRGESRAVWAELAGPVAITAGAASIALAGGAALPLAASLWILMIARSIPSVLYVRARLRLDRNRPVSVAGANAAHLAAVGAGVALLLAGSGSKLALFALALLAIRAAAGLSSRRRALHPKVVGFSEIGYGVVAVAAFAAGALTRF